MHVWTKDKLFIKKNIYEHLKRIDSNYDKHQTTLLFSEHHLSHAASAFFPSPFREAAILTIDGVGEYATTSLALGRSNKISILQEIHFPHSIGLFYSAITYFLGFKVNSDEYKVMGLAAYGNPESNETKHYQQLIEQHLIQLHTDGSFQLNTQFFSFEHALTMVCDKDWEQLFNLPKRSVDTKLTQQHCNLAYAFQKVTENVVVKNAHEIIARENVFQYKTQNVHGHGKGSYAGFSDIFRYKLLYEYGGIWTDMDITCLQHFNIQSDYFFRYHHKLGAVGNFMKCPKNSALMLWCYEQAMEQITADNKNWMLPIVILNEGIKKFNLNAHIHQLSNNDSFPEVMRLLSSSVKIPSEWKLIHWMNEEFRRLEIDKNCVLNHSVLQQLYAQYHIKHTVFTGKAEWQKK